MSLMDNPITGAQVLYDLGLVLLNAAASLGVGYVLNRTTRTGDPPKNKYY